MSQHVYPLHDAIEHMTDLSGLCWCDPNTLKLCPACEAEPEAEPDCWRCKGLGTIPAEEGYEGPFIFVHFLSQDNDDECFLEDGRDGSIHEVLR